MHALWKRKRHYWRTESLLLVILSLQRTVFTFLAGSQSRSRWVSESDKVVLLPICDVHGYASRQGLTAQLSGSRMASMLIVKKCHPFSLLSERYSWLSWSLLVAFLLMKYYIYRNTCYLI